VAVAVLDASVVIAFLDPGDPTHQAAGAALKEILAEHEVVLPASALAEVLVGAYGRGRDAVATVDGFVAEVGIRIEPVTARIARRAAQLRARHPRLRLPDALVLATGEVIEAATIVTADRAWRGKVPRVRIV